MEWEPFVTLRQLAKHLAASESGVRKWVHEGRIPYTRVGNELRFKISEVEAALGCKPAKLPPVDPAQTSFDFYDQPFDQPIDSSE